MLLGLTLVINPVWAKECFNFDKIFAPGKSNQELTEDLKYFHTLLTKFFFVKDGHTYENVPLSISWKTARELSRFMEREGLDIRVREDVYRKDMESIYGASVGAAFVSGFAISTYASPKVKDLLKKFVISRLTRWGSGIFVGVGAVASAWFGVSEHMPGGSCALVLRSSLFRQGIPLSSLTFDNFMKAQEYENIQLEPKTVLFWRKIWNSF